MNVLRQTHKTFIAILVITFFFACGKTGEGNQKNPVKTPPSKEKQLPQQKPDNSAEKDITVDNDVTDKDLKELGYEAPEEASETEIDYDNLAKVYCDCSATSKKLNDEMQELAQAGESERFRDLSAKVQQEFKKSINCAKGHKQKATKKALNKGVLVKKMKGICPDLPAELVIDLITKA